MLVSIYYSPSLPPFVPLSSPPPSSTLEACRLLQLLPGSAKLTLSLLQAAVVGGGATIQNHTYSEAVSALNDMGVHTLDPVLAQQVLRLRILPS